MWAVDDKEAPLRVVVGEHETPPATRFDLELKGCGGTRAAGECEDEEHRFGVEKSNKVGSDVHNTSSGGE